MKSSVMAAMAAFASLVCWGASAQDIGGTWLTPEADSHVTITPCGDGFCGEISWLKEPNDASGKAKLDKQNENEALRTRPILGLPMIRGLKPVAAGSYDDGNIYNPRDGATYASEARLVNSDTLEVKGCVLFFCKAQTWTRVAN